jgi:hypothetical protein
MSNDSAPRHVIHCRIFNTTPSHSMDPYFFISARVPSGYEASYRFVVRESTHAMFMAL